MTTIFLDRDGVINKDPGGWTRYSYVTRWDEFIFLPGSLEALAALKGAGFRVIVISNQAGVGKGYFSHDELKEVDRKMVEEVRRNGGDIAASYYCVHSKEDECGCRKPKTGLIEMARLDHDFDPHESYFIGDTERDIEAGTKCGFKTILVLTGHAKASDAESWPIKPDLICGDLRTAVEAVVNAERKK